MTRLEIGRIWANNYEVVAYLGSGTMADAYMARRLSEGTLVALKVQKEDLPEETERHFSDEADT
jgi:hypothetical protein